MALTSFKSNLYLMGFLASASFFISCKDKETTTDSIPIQQEQTLEQKKQSLQNAAPQTTTNSNGDLALNPAHGQPGHRCDIPVGAPLNNAAGNTNATPAKAVNLNNPNTTPASSSGSGAINPPHGQPGHRCDVKVGDPL